jgi:hypothetical protein
MIMDFDGYKMLLHLVFQKMNNVFQQIDEFTTYKEFSSHMQQLNIKQITIVDDILYQKMKNPTKPFHICLTSGVGTRKMVSLMCIIQNMLQYYTKQITIVDP